MIAVTWLLPAGVFFTSIIGWQYFVGGRTVKAEQCYVQYMENALFNCILQVCRPTLKQFSQRCSVGSFPETTHCRPNITMTKHGSFVIPN